jgi:hypothetical protein
MSAMIPTDSLAPLIRERLAWQAGAAGPTAVVAALNERERGLARRAKVAVLIPLGALVLLPVMPDVAAVGLLVIIVVVGIVVAPGITLLAASWRYLRPSLEALDWIQRDAVATWAALDGDATVPIDAAVALRRLDKAAKSDYTLLRATVLAGEGDRAGALRLLADGPAGAQHAAAVERTRALILGTPESRRAAYDAIDVDRDPDLPPRDTIAALWLDACALAVSGRDPMPALRVARAMISRGGSHRGSGGTAPRPQ